MKIFYILLLAALLQASNAEIMNATKLIKAEVSDSVFKRDYKIFLKYKGEIDKLDRYNANAYSKKNSTRFKILDNLLEIQKKSDSLIISQYMLNQTLKYISIKDSVKFMKYAKPSIDTLYKNRLCDGFLFMGDYEEKLKGNKIEALNIYEQGFKICKIKWKRFELRSRASQVKYRLGKIRGY